MRPVVTLFKMVNVCPSDNVVPTVTTRLLPVIVTPPVATRSWSYWLPTVVPLISTRKLEADASVSAPVLNTAVLLPPFPGAMFAPALTATGPLICQFRQGWSRYRYGAGPAGARTSCVIYEQGPPGHGCSTAVGIIPGKS